MNFPISGSQIHITFRKFDVVANNYIMLRRHNIYNTPKTFVNNMSFIKYLNTKKMLLNIIIDNAARRCLNNSALIALYLFKFI